MFSVAAVQAAPAFLDLQGCLDRLDTWTAKAAADGAKLVAFGETWIPGYPAWLDSCPGAAVWADPGARALYQRLYDNSVTVPGPACDRLARAARTNRVALVVGVHERAGHSLYNTILTFGADGTLLNRHRKLVPTYSERLIWGQGDGGGLTAVDLGFARVGALVCWEHWMPLARQVMHNAGEQIHVAQWPGVHEMHLIASRHYAFEGRCFVLAVGSILRRGDLPPDLPLAEKYQGPPEGLLIAGGTAIIGPNGKCLAGPVADAETVVTAELDLDEITKEALTLDVSGHYSRPDLFEVNLRRPLGVD